MTSSLGVIPDLLSVLRTQAVETPSELTASDFSGRYSPEQYRAQFGSLERAVGLAGTNTELADKHLYRDDLLYELKHVQNALGRDPTADEFDEIGRYPSSLYIERHQSWDVALSVAADHAIAPDATLTIESLLVELRRIRQCLDQHELTITDLACCGLIPLPAFLDEFATWDEVITAQLALSNNRRAETNDGLMRVPQSLVGWADRLGGAVTRREVLTHLQELAEAIEHTPNINEVYRYAGDTPAALLFEHFDTLDDAVTTANLPARDLAATRDPMGNPSKTSTPTHTDLYCDLFQLRFRHESGEVKESWIERKSLFDVADFVSQFGTVEEANERYGREMEQHGFVHHLVDEIAALGKELGKRPTREQFITEYDIDQGAIYALFGSWSDAVEWAGFERPHDRTGYSRDELIAAIQQAHAELGSDFTVTAFEEQTGISQQTVGRRFGSWLEAFREAGIDPHEVKSKVRLPDDELRRLVYEAYQEFGDDLTGLRFEATTGVSTNTLHRRFGGWEDALEEAGVPLGVLSPQANRYSSQKLRQWLLADYREYGPDLTTTTFRDRHGVSGTAIYNRYDSWNDAIDEAETMAAYRQAYLDVSETLDRPATLNEFITQSRYTKADVLATLELWTVAVKSASESVGAAFDDDSLALAVRAVLDRSSSECSLETFVSQTGIPRDVVASSFASWNEAVNAAHAVDDEFIPTVVDTKRSEPDPETAAVERQSEANQPRAEVDSEPEAPSEAETTSQPGRFTLVMELMTLHQELDRIPTVNDLSESEYTVVHYEDEFGSWDAALQAANVN